MTSRFERFAVESRARIASHMHSVFDRFHQDFVTITRDGAWLESEMRDYAGSGKMLRGTLALLGARLMGVKETPQALSLASSLELLQAGLLIHDDIMDRDDQRRGKPTFHKRIEHRLPRTLSTTGDLIHFAEAEGICAGDLCFFLAWNELVETPPSVSSLVAKEHARVTLAQMEDMNLGFTADFPNLETVLRMYTHKTARYTVALPLMAGALLCPSVYSSILSLIESYGEALGVVFQIRDDRLGLFGTEEQIGKPVGSDIREGKKTPFIIALLPTLNPQERVRFDAMFGKEARERSAIDIEWIRDMILNKGVDTLIQQRSALYVRRAHEAVEALAAYPNIDRSALDLLADFLEYSVQRQK